jgi:hypothetical protein
MGKEFLPLHPTVRDQLELAQFLSRPVYIGSINTPDPGTTSISYPFSTWVTVAAIAEKLKYYTMINAVFHLRLDISYNPHYYGLSRACLVRDLTAAQGVFSTYRVSAIPGEFQDYSISNSVHLSIRIGNRGLGTKLQGNASQFLGVEQACSLLYATYCPVSRDDGLSIGTPLFRMFGWCTDVSLSGATAYITASDREDAPLRGPVPVAPTAPAGLQRSYNTVLSLINAAIPGSRPARVASALGPLMAAALGWSRPTSGVTAERVNSSLLANLSPASGVDTSSTLTLDPMAQTTVDTSRVDDDAVDKLSFAYLTTIPGYVGSFVWATTAAPASLLATIPITPTMMGDAGVSTWYPTPTGGCAACFDYWTGSLKIRLKSSATPYHRGKIVVAYLPNTVTETALTMDVITATTQHEVLDIASGFDKEFLVKWSQPEPYKQTYPFTKYGNTLTSSSATNNGSLRIFVLDALSATVAGANLTITMWLSAGPDLDLQVVTSQLRNYECRSDVAVPVAFNQSLSRPTTTVFGSFDIDAAHVANTYGERCLSLRTLFHRYYAWFAAGCDKGTPPANLYGIVLKSQWPTAPAIRMDTTAAWGGLGATVDMWLTPLTYAMASFTGYKGGFRHKIFCVNTNTSGGMPDTIGFTERAGADTTSVTLSPIVYHNSFSAAGTNPGDATFQTGLFIGQNMSTGTAVLRESGVMPLVCDVEVRPNGGQLYSQFPVSDTNVVPDLGFDLLVVCPPTGGDRSYPGLLATAAIAEDFVPIQFVGFPQMAVGGPTTITGTQYPSV